MKIEKLAFKNINSLAGEFEIDFLNPALTQSGMFVITGPTGSGKTTILDAISFALFGLTPRQKATPQLDRNEIMTYGADECSATVYFEQDGVHYRSSVSQKRATRKDAINPFGKVTYLLHRFQENEGWKELANAATAFSQMVPKIIGLNFDNFKRSMLLAQGEFAAFLNTKDTERAQVLSTITGTEIYDHIGRIAHERVAAVQKQIDALEPKEEMTTELREQMEDSRDAAQTALAEFDEQLAHIRLCLKWLEDEAKQKKAADEAALKSQAAAQALREFEEQLAPVLNRAESALQIKPQADALALSMKQLQKLRADMVALDTELQALKPSLEQYVKMVAQARADIEDKAPALQKQLDAVQAEMRPMETRLGMLKKDVEDKSGVDARNQKKASSLIAHLAELDGQLKKEQATLLSHKEELEKMADAAQLGERLPLIKARLKDWMAAPKVQGVLLPHARIEAELSAAQAALAEAETRPAGLRSIAELKRAQLDIEDKLAALYLDFREGKLDRCPCCGSTTPGERHAVRNEEVQAAEEAVVQAENAVKLARDKVSSLETMLRVSALRLEFAAALGAEVESLAAARQQVKLLGQRHDAFTSLQAAQQQSEKRCAELQGEFEKESARSEEVKRSAEESSRQLTAAKEEYAALAAAFVARWGEGCSADALAAQINKTLEDLNLRGESAQKQLDAARLKETKIRSAHEQLASQQPELEAQVAEQKAEFARLLQTYGFAEPGDYMEAVRNDMPRRESLQTLQNQRVERAKTSRALCEREAAALVELQAACPLQEGEASEALAEKLEQVTAVRNEQNEVLTGILTALRVDDLAREANAGIRVERERLERERNQHALLKKVLGDSQDGFKKFAQQITFDLLLERANVELRKFTNRYELRRSSKDRKLLDISVIDHELGIVEGRTVSNLSGGETFLVSLSLALGLSHLSQATRIDSLFLDEGFGTLDADTLEQVISSLQKLHETGKTIGIISHVPALSERIAARIEVQRTREGFSTLTGNPAVTCKKSA